MNNALKIHRFISLWRYLKITTASMANLTLMWVLWWSVVSTVLESNNHIFLYDMHICIMKSSKNIILYSVSFLIRSDTLIFRFEFKSCESLLIIITRLNKSNLTQYTSEFVSWHIVNINKQFLRRRWFDKTFLNRIVLFHQNNSIDPLSQ